jgi:hypothetical protein
MLVSRIDAINSSKRKNQMAADDPNLGRREFVQGAMSGVALAAAPGVVLAASHGSADKAAVLAKIPGMHAANLERLQEWIALPSIAAENRNFPQGPEYMAPAVAGFFEKVKPLTAADTLAKLKGHLASHGFGDIEVNMSGGYNPTQTDPDSKLIKAQLATYLELGLDPQLWPRSAGSWPGYIFTESPLSLPAGHFGLGHGTGAHAPDEYYLIESTNPKVKGLDGAVASFVEY